MYPWRTVGTTAIFGPLLGGLPYFWMPPAIIVAFVAGLLPALAGGAIFARWLQFAVLPSGWKGAAIGALCGSVASTLCVYGFLAIEGLAHIGPDYWHAIREAWPIAGFFALHGALAGAVIGAIEARAAQKRTLLAWEGPQPFSQRSVGEAS